MNFKTEILSINNIFYLLSLIIALLVAIPVFTICFGFFQNTSEYFSILSDTFLFNYIINSLLLLIGVLTLTFIFGFFSAYLLSFYSFPGSRFLRWGLILSFAVPAYIYAFTVYSFFENYGLAYTILTYFFGEGNYNKIIPKFDGLIGAIISLSFSLFGYVYVLTTSAFFYQSQNLIDVGRSLGFSKIKKFINIILPTVRPSIVVGLSLVAMETLSDFGTVSFLGLSTLTTGIYNSWVGFDDLATANRLSFILIFFIFLLFSIEFISRKEARYHIAGIEDYKIKKLKKLSSLKGLLASTYCYLLLFFSFILPIGLMLFWTQKYFEYIDISEFIKLNLNTVYLVVSSSIIILILSVISNFSNRVLNKNSLKFINTISISGYAMPGIILALALMSFSSWITSITNLNFKDFIIGSSFGLIVAYIIRFYALSFNSIKSNYLKINQSVDESASLLGYSKLKVFCDIHFPFLKRSCLIIFVLIATEIIKELPIALVLRPYNFDTFATKAFSYAEQDLIELAAFPSLCLVIWSIIFLVISFKYILPRNENE